LFTVVKIVKLIRDKRFYKDVLTIGVPIMLQNLVSFSVSMADTVMLSRASLSDELVSAADLANKPVFLLVLTLIGLTGGGIALSSQYWGKGEVAPIRKITAMILQTGILISFLAGTAVLLFPSGTMRIFTADPVVIGKGAEYLSIVGWSYYIVGITVVLAAMLRSVEIVRVALYADITALLISVSFNWVLIFGNLGFPALGIRGAAISTLTARIVSLLIISTYVFVVDKRLGFRPRHIPRFDRRLFGDILKYGFPVLLGQMTWALGITAQAMIIGRVDYTVGDFVAANAANSVIYQLFIVAVYGAANASVVIVGKSIGEGKLLEARHKADTMYKLGAMAGALVCISIITTRKWVIGIFGLSPETEAMATELLVLVGIVAFLGSIATVTIAGVFRGGGDTRFCLGIEITAMWGVAIPLALLMAFVFKAPAPIV
jgi:putative MATE family efflux protein